MNVDQPPPTIPVRIITPHSGLEGFRAAIRELVTEFPQARRLAWRFFLRDTRAAHRQSLLGYLWLVLPALAVTLVWVFLNNQDVIDIDSGPVPYPIFVLCGTILWGAFNGSLVAMLGIVNEAKGLLSKVNFPREALVYSALLKSLTESLIPTLLLVPAVWFFPVPWQPAMLLFLLALLACLLLGAGIGLILVPLATLYSDVSRGAQLLLRFGFFFTPVIFKLPAEGAARTLMSLNPVTPLIVSGRAWFVGTGDAMSAAFFAVIGLTALAVALGLVAFKVVLPQLIERVSA